MTAKQIYYHLWPGQEQINVCDLLRETMDTLEEQGGLDTGDVVMIDEFFKAGDSLALVVTSPPAERRP